MPEYEIKPWTVVIGLIDRSGEQAKGEAVEILSDTSAGHKYSEVSDALNDRNLLVFNLGDINANLIEAMGSYDVPEGVTPTEEMLRAIWAEVHTESAVSNMGDLIYDACIDYVREHLREG